MNRSLLGLKLTLVLGFCSFLSPLPADDIVSPFAANKQFSADQTVTTANMTMTTKVYSDNGKMRTETNASGMQMVSIVRPDQQKIYSVMVAQKMVMEMPYDPSKAAPQMTSSGQDGKFELVGPDTVNGIACNKYKVTSKDNKTSFMWIDTAKKTPVKMAASDNSYSVTWSNYKVGPQDPSLFEPPTDYQVMKMPGAGAPGGAPAGGAGGSGQ